jgi:hypothetical protein
MGIGSHVWHEVAGGGTVWLKDADGWLMLTNQ